MDSKKDDNEKEKGTPVQAPEEKSPDVKQPPHHPTKVSGVAKIKDPPEKGTFLPTTVTFGSQSTQSVASVSSQPSMQASFPPSLHSQQQQYYPPFSYGWPSGTQHSQPILPNPFFGGASFQDPNNRMEYGVGHQRPSIVPPKKDVTKPAVKENQASATTQTTTTLPEEQKPAAKIASRSNQDTIEKQAVSSTLKDSDEALDSSEKVKDLSSIEAVTNDALLKATKSSDQASIAKQVDLPKAGSGSLPSHTKKTEESVQQNSLTTEAKGLLADSSRNARIELYTAVRQSDEAAESTVTKARDTAIRDVVGKVKSLTEEGTEEPESGLDKSQEFSSKESIRTVTIGKDPVARNEAQPLQRESSCSKSGRATDHQTLDAESNLDSGEDATESDRTAPLTQNMSKRCPSVSGQSSKPVDEPAAEAMIERKSADAVEDEPKDADKAATPTHDDSRSGETSLGKEGIGAELTENKTGHATSHQTIGRSIEDAGETQSAISKAKKNSTEDIAGKSPESLDKAGRLNDKPVGGTSLVPMTESTDGTPPVNADNETQTSKVTPEKHAPVNFQARIDKQEESSIVESPDEEMSRPCTEDDQVTPTTSAFNGHQYAQSASPPSDGPTGSSRDMDLLSIEGDREDNADRAETSRPSPCVDLTADDSDVESLPSAMNFVDLTASFDEEDGQDNGDAPYAAAKRRSRGYAPANRQRRSARSHKPKVKRRGTRHSYTKKKSTVSAVSSAAGTVRSHLKEPNDTEAPSTLLSGKKRKRTDTKYKVGTLVRKFFEGFGWFYGKVDSVDQGLYEVIYSDGDVEDYDDDEFEMVVMRPPERVTKKTLPIQNIPSLPNANEKDALSLWRIQGLEGPCSFSTNGLPRILCKDAAKMADFFLFVLERQLMWVRRNQGIQEPVSANPIFGDFWFCNNYRELDRGTAYFHAYVMELRDSKDEWTREEWLTEVVWASYSYRCVNRVESFEKCGFPSRDDSSDFFERAREYRETSGKAFFTAAHQTTTFDKYEEDIKKALKREAALLHKVAKMILKSNEKKDWHKALKLFDGVGDFLAWQILCDLQESGCVKIKEDDFYCRLGPGAKQGLKFIFGPKSKFESDLEKAISLVQYQDVFYQRLGLEFPYWNDGALTIKEIEHALCEYSKFKRIQADHLKNRKVAGMRKRLGESNCDDNKPCRDCNINSYTGHICDSCMLYFCKDCAPQRDTDCTSWICPYCRAFDEVCFV